MHRTIAVIKWICLLMDNNWLMSRRWYVVVKRSRRWRVIGFWMVMMIWVFHVVRFRLWGIR